MCIVKFIPYLMQLIYRARKIKFLITFIFFLFLLSFVILANKPIDGYLGSRLHPRFPPNDLGHSSKHKLCLLVPFRDRFDELSEFVPYMHKFLSANNVPFEIIVINQVMTIVIQLIVNFKSIFKRLNFLQVDPFRFNRASLLNTGFKHILETTSCDYIGLHDVDLMPANDDLLYSFPETGPMHLAGEVMLQVSRELNR